MGSRVHELDALRGAALFGVVLVNVFVFHAPYSHFSEFYGGFEGRDALIVEGVAALAAGKFLWIFAFLFGYGAGVQQAAHGDDFPRRYARRMLVLALVGALHVVLLWYGDILWTYGLLGLLLILVRGWSDRRLLALSAALLLAAPLYYFGWALLGWLDVGMRMNLTLGEMVVLVQEGTYGELLRLRLQEWWAFLPENLVWFVPKTLGVFFLGLVASRRNLVAALREHRRRAATMSLLFVFVSVLWVVGRPAVFSLFDLTASPILRPVLIGVNVLFETMMAAAYTVGLLVAFQSGGRVAELLARVGRLALTNYLLQSLICVLLVSSFGLGLYGTLTPTALVILAVSVFAVNIGLSWIWLRHFERGPLEAAWRRLSRT